MALRHIRFHSLAEMVAAMDRIIDTGGRDGVPVDYLDGVVFSADESYLCVGMRTTTPGPVSDYTGQDIYYRSIQHDVRQRRRQRRPADDPRLPVALGHRLVLVLTRVRRAEPAAAALVAAALPAQQLLLEAGGRRPALRHRRPDREAQAAVRRVSGWCRTSRCRSNGPREFLEWFLDTVPIEPIWLCPLRLRDHEGWPLYPIRPDRTYVNIGFWSSVPAGATEGATNRLIEAKVSALDGHKSLYSDSFYTREEFDELYGGRDLQHGEENLRSRFTSPRPLRKGGATTMTTTREPARTKRQAEHGRDPGDLHRNGRQPLKFTAYDGSTAGPDDAELGLDLRTPRGTTYLATAPGELGLARAYVSGDLQTYGVHPGDPYELLKALTDRVEFKRPSAMVLANIVRSIGVEHLLPVAPPPQEALPRWRRIAAGSCTARLATRRPSTTTTTSPTRSTSGCSDRR